MTKKDWNVPFVRSVKGTAAATAMPSPVEYTIWIAIIIVCTRALLNIFDPKISYALYIILMLWKSY